VTSDANSRSARLLRDPRVAVLLFVVVSLLWGSAFPAVKRCYVLMAVQPGDVALPLIFAGSRFLVAGLLLIAVGALRARGAGLWRGLLRWVLLLGVIQTFLQYAAFYVGMSLTTGIKASILVAAGSLFLALLSPLVYRADRLTRLKLLALGLGFAGVILANRARGGAAVAGHAEWLGDLLILGTALCSAVASLLSKRLVQRISPVALNGGQLITGGLLLVAVALPLGPRLPPVSVELVALTLYLTVVTAVAFSLYYLVVKHHDLTRVAAYRFLIPLFAVTESALLIPGERLHLPLILAAILVISSIWLINRPVRDRDH